jgi:ribosomal protein S12 methylthiotransferase accessory factor
MSFEQMSRMPQLSTNTETLTWWHQAKLENQPYLRPDTSKTQKVQADYPHTWHEDLYLDVMHCVQVAAKNGLETLILDLSRPDVELPVVKVIVPGLYHFWPRFAPGRLYQVPVTMGWSPQPRREEQLNPHPIFY